MTANQELSEELSLYFTSTSLYNKAVLLTGGWGSGKTYFANEYELSGYKKIYLSVFGLDNIYSLQESLLVKNVFDENYKKEVSKSHNPSAGARLGVSLGYNFTYSYTLKEVAKIWFSDSKKIQKEFAKKLLIIDDIERCLIDIEVLFGFIDFLLEKCNAKIIIICNEDKLKQKQKIKYYQYKEKIIARILNVNKISSLSAALDFANDKFKHNDFIKNNKELLINIFNVSSHKNIRLFLYAFDLLNCILSALKRKNEKIFKLWLKNEQVFIDYIIKQFIYITEYQAQHAGNTCLDKEGDGEKNIKDENYENIDREIYGIELRQYRDIEIIFGDFYGVRCLMEEKITSAEFVDRYLLPYINLIIDAKNDVLVRLQDWLSISTYKEFQDLESQVQKIFNDFDNKKNFVLKEIQELLALIKQIARFIKEDDVEKFADFTAQNMECKIRHYIEKSFTYLEKTTSVVEVKNLLDTTKDALDMHKHMGGKQLYDIKILYDAAQKFFNCKPVDLSDFHEGIKTWVALDAPRKYIGEIAEKTLASGFFNRDDRDRLYIVLEALKGEANTQVLNSFNLLYKELLSIIEMRKKSEKNPLLPPFLTWAECSLKIIGNELDKLNKKRRYDAALDEKNNNNNG